MFDEDNILNSPREIALDPNAYEPLRLVLEDPHKSRWTKLLVTTLVCFALVCSGGAVRSGDGPISADTENNPGFWHVSLVSLLYWIGISQGMVALSAILRITHASWRYPLNRLAGHRLAVRPLGAAAAAGAGRGTAARFIISARAGPPFGQYLGHGRMGRWCGTRWRSARRSSPAGCCCI